MPTVIIRPDSTINQSGYTPSSNVHNNINDDSDSTFAQQTAAVATLRVGFANPSIPAGATINHFNLSLRAAQDRRPTPNAIISISDGSAAYTNFTLPSSGNFAASATTYTSGDFDTQQDGSSALTASYFNNFVVTLTPNTDGAKLFELFITIDYSVGYGHGILDIQSTDVAAVLDIDAADIGSVIDI